MITKAVIKKLADTKSNYYAVYIPWMRKANDSEEDATLNATKSYINGVKDDLNVGDIVYVGFEENELGKPIILGKLYTNKEEEVNTASNVKTLLVQDKAILPGNTMIGNIDVNELRKKIDAITTYYLYQHHIYLKTSTCVCYFTITNSVEDKISITEGGTYEYNFSYIISYLENQDFVSNKKILQATGILTSNSATYPIAGVYTSNNKLNLLSFDSVSINNHSLSLTSTPLSSLIIDSTDVTELTDTVVRLV